MVLVVCWTNTWGTCECGGERGAEWEDKIKAEVEAL